MKICMSKKILSSILAVIFIFSCFSVVKASALPPPVIWENDFENGGTPSYSSPSSSIEPVGQGNHALVFYKTFDGTDSWDNNQCEFDFNANYSQPIATDSQLVFRIILPESAVHFNNLLKFKAALKVGNNWQWYSGDCGELKASNFYNEGNGYCYADVSSDISIPEKADLKSVVIQISGWKCNYSGMMAIDDLFLYNGSPNFPLIK